MEKAKALASVGLLAGLHRGEIMTHYLGSADLLLDACLGPMSTGNNSCAVGHVKTFGYLLKCEVIVLVVRLIVWVCEK